MNKDSKIKIAVFVLYFPVLSETFIYNQCISLLKLGHDVKIYSRNKINYKIIHKEILDSGLINNIVYTPSFPSNLFFRLAKAAFLISKNFKSIPQILKTLNFFYYKKEALRLNIFYNSIPFLPYKSFDVIHCHFGYVANDIIKLIDLGILSGKLITSFHGIDLSNQILKTENYKRTFELSEYVVANTNFMKERLIAINCPVEKIKIIPVGLDTHKFRKRGTIPFTGEKLKLISIGRLIDVKGMHNCISVMDLLINKFNMKNLEMTIVGQGPLESKLRRQIHDFKLVPYINLVGRQTQEEIINSLENSHVFLLLGNTDSEGREETQGLVIQEAQAMELPVIVSNFGGVSEGLIDNQTGFLVEQGDISKVAELIIHLMKNPGLIQEMGQRGRSYIENKYDQGLISSELLKLYC